MEVAASAPVAMSAAVTSSCGSCHFLSSSQRSQPLDSMAPVPVAEPIDTVPRVLKQAGLMGLPDEATREPGA